MFDKFDIYIEWYLHDCMWKIAAYLRGQSKLHLVHSEIVCTCFQRPGSNMQNIIVLLNTHTSFPATKQFRKTLSIDTRKFSTINGHVPNKHFHLLTKPFSQLSSDSTFVRSYLLGFLYLFAGAVFSGAAGD